MRRVGPALAFLTLFASAGARAQAPAAPPVTPEPVAIEGFVKDKKTDYPVPEALVLLQDSCLQGQRETTAGADGLYRFRDLPPGRYTAQVLVGQANVNKSFTATGGVFRASFTIDPANKFVIHHTIETPVRLDPVSRTKIT